MDTSSRFFRYVLLIFTQTLVAWSLLIENGCPLGSNDLISDLTHPCRYDPLTKPPSLPLVITARMYVYHLIMTHSSNVFKVQALIQLRWRDERLRYNGSSELLGDKARLWKPYIPFSSGHQSQIMGLNREDTVATITPLGDVLFSKRLHSELLCQAEGRNFPFDLLECYLLMDNWMHNGSHVQLKWEELDPVHLPSNMFGLTEFDLTSFETEIPEQLFNNPTNFMPLSETNKGSLRVVFHFARKFGFYFWDYYVPSVLLVVTSWGSFWVNPEVVPCRVWLATCTMLGFFGLGVMNDATPKPNHLKMNDLWFIGCNLFIFMSLAEFAFVNIVHRQEPKPFPLKRMTGKYILKTSLMTEATPWKKKSYSCPSSPELQRRESKSPNMRGQQIRVEFKDPKLRQRLSRRRKAFTGTHMTNQQMAHWIDCRSRTLFPLAFLIFNLIFWILMFV